MKPDYSKICFGLSEETDRSSMAIFLELAGKKAFSKTIAERLSSQEISEFTDYFMTLIRKHLNEKEYHELFLNDPNHHHSEE